MPKAKPIADDIESNEEELDEAKLAKEAEAAKVQLAEQRKTRQTEQNPPREEEKKYDKDEVQSMIAQALKNFKKQMEGGFEEEQEVDKNRKHTLTVPRIKNKFIIAFKNMNTDEYYPDGVVYAQDIYDSERKTNVPWVTLVFLDKKEDGTNEELMIPLRTAIEKSNKVTCEIVKVDEKDTSYDFGTVEKIEVKDYAPQGKGDFVKAKVTQKKYQYVVKLPITGQEITVQPEVINWDPGAAKTANRQ